MEPIKTRWVTWNEISSFKDQLIKLEYELIKIHHYPDREILLEYIESHVEALEGFLKSGNTFFWGAFNGAELVGYYWAYITLFIGKKRWVLRSLMIKNGYQNRGLGKRAIEEGLIKAKEKGCFDAVTEYTTFNHAAEHLYKNAGYCESRIEVVKKL